jgi:hypothetical protein
MIEAVRVVRVRSGVNTVNPDRISTCDAGGLSKVVRVV